MSKVDWSLAPSDAQIYSPEFGGSNAVWYKVDGGKVFCWPIGSHGWSERHTMIGELIYRPKQDPKPWSGPEDGLPPINERVEVLWSSITGKYVEGIILAHDEDRAVFRFVTGERKGEYQADKLHFSSGKLWPNFRPIKTPEQLAAEKRETAIREIMDVADVDCRVTAARLVDAGFKREVV